MNRPIHAPSLKPSPEVDPLSVPAARDDRHRPAASTHRPVKLLRAPKG